VLNSRALRMRPRVLPHGVCKNRQEHEWAASPGHAKTA
jgi:hypothetical protein